MGHCLAEMDRVSCNQLCTGTSWYSSSLSNMAIFALPVPVENWCRCLETFKRGVLFWKAGVFNITLVKFCTTEVFQTRGLFFGLLSLVEFRTTRLCSYSVFLESISFTRYEEFVHKIGTGGLKACALLIWSSRNQEPGCCFSLHIILLLTEFSST